MNRLKCSQVVVILRKILIIVHIDLYLISLGACIPICFVLGGAEIHLYSNQLMTRPADRLHMLVDCTPRKQFHGEVQVVGILQENEL